MSQPRSLVNHARYLAGIQLDAWCERLGAASAPAWVVDAAFAPALQVHLRHAYGWLLLSAARVTSPPTEPPGCVAELPPLPRGLTRPVEVDRCEVLEREGWLAQLLAPLPVQPKPSAGKNLLASTSSMPDLAIAEEWCAAFDALVADVDHALDES